VAVSLYWMQCGGCGGDSMSALNADSPNILEIMNDLDIDILWHPSSSFAPPAEQQRIFSDIIDRRTKLDILCIEGAVIRGPENTGLFETVNGKPKKDLVRQLADRADVVIAVGTCASFGGVTGAGETDAVGLQFSKKKAEGFLGKSFRSGRGLPVINLPGCPVHPTVLAGALTALATNTPMALNAYNAPSDYYGMLVHQGCTRNEYHEYQIEETDFGRKGCLFFHLGCKGPMAHAPCNKFLWNRRNCKTRSGVPCNGCTEPDFPGDAPFFYTPNIVGLPINLPDGVSRPHYLAYKSMAAASAPERLKLRKTGV
jgi:NiFe hydrogenase small subunit HydA